jgi:NADP-dependent 3-hydroxy acid dehydrogenase YdfG
MHSIQKQVAWITGGATGIGLAAARALAKEGAVVVISGRRSAEIEAAVASAKADGLTLHGLATDVSDAAQVERSAQQIAAQHGPISILVCSAGTNLKGVAQCVMSVLPGMRAQANGVIVVVSSWAGREFLPFTGMAYNSAKAALTMLARSVNHDEGRHGVRCTLVQPGEVYTPILKTRPRPPSTADCETMLRMEDLGDLVRYVVTLPPHVCLNEVLISPTHNRFDIGADDLKPAL